MKIKSIKSAGFEPVYNITVRQFHNFLIKGGMILKNCDALRYFVAGQPAPQIIKAIKPKTLPFALEEDEEETETYMNWA